MSAVILGEEHGWASATTLSCLGLSVAAFVLFVLVERRAEQPVVPLWVFRVRPVTVANGLSALVGGMLPATMFFLVLYLQRVLGMDPLTAGLALTPGAVGIALGARGASRWIGVLGPRRSFVLGTLVSAAALAWLSQLDVEGRYAVDVLVPLTLAMAGFGAAGLPLTVTATSGLGPGAGRPGVGPAGHGAAGGQRRRSGGPGGGGRRVGRRARRARAAALTAGFGAGFLVGAGVLVVASVGALALPGRQEVHQPG